MYIYMYMHARMYVAIYISMYIYIHVGRLYVCEYPLMEYSAWSNIKRPLLTKHLNAAICLEATYG